MGLSFVPGHDREPHRRRARRRGHRLRPRQHEPPDRRRDRARRDERDRRHLDEQLRGRAHAVTATSAAALDHGFQTALYVLTGLLLVGALIAVTLVKPTPLPQVRPQNLDAEIALEDAA